MNRDELERRLATVIEACASRLSPPSGALLRELNQAGEPGVALEILCSNLEEGSIPVPEPTLAEIRVLGTAMGIDPTYWADLNAGTGA